MPMIIFLGLAIFLAFILKQKLSDRDYSKKDKARQSSTTEVPEELRRKAQEMLEQIDWDIRLLEKQIETEKDKKKRKRLQREIEEKRQQYKSIADKFGW